MAAKKKIELPSELIVEATEYGGYHGDTVGDVVTSKDNKSRFGRYKLVEEVVVGTVSTITPIKKGRK